MIVVTGVRQPWDDLWYLQIEYAPVNEPPWTGENEELPPDNETGSATLADEELQQLCEDNQDKSWFQDFLNSLDRNPSGIDRDGDGDSDYNDWKTEFEAWWNGLGPVDQALYGIENYIEERDRLATWGAVFDVFQGDDNNNGGG